MLKYRKVPFPKSVSTAFVAHCSLYFLYPDCTLQGVDNMYDPPDRITLWWTSHVKTNYAIQVSWKLQPPKVRSYTPWEFRAWKLRLWKFRPQKFRPWKLRPRKIRSWKLRPLKIISKDLNLPQFLSLFYGHAMFIGNSQKGARYLFSLVHRCHVNQTVKNIPGFTTEIERQSRYSVVQIEVSFACTWWVSDKREKIKISILSGCCHLCTLHDIETLRIETSWNLFFIYFKGSEFSGSEVWDFGGEFLWYPC